MAIVPSTKYSGQIDTADPAAYPQGAAKNVGTAGDGTGTPLEKDWVNDLWGFLQALLDRAGITPSGNPDEVGTSDYLDSLHTMLGGTGNLAQVPYTLTGAVYDGHIFDASTQTTAATGVCWSQDGVYLFVCSNTAAWRYSCTTPWDVSTASYDTETYTGFTTEDNLAEGIAVSDDGLSLYICGNQNHAVFQYTMSPAYDLSSASYASKSMSFSSQTTSPRDMQISQDGSIVYIMGQGDVWKYDLGTDWDTSTGAYDTGNTVAVTEAVMSGFVVSADGTRLLMAGDNSPETVFAYELTTAHELTTASVIPQELDYSELETQPLSMTASTTGSRLYIIGRDLDSVIEFYIGKVVME